MRLTGSFLKTLLSAALKPQTFIGEKPYCGHLLLASLPADPATLKLILATLFPLQISSRLPRAQRRTPSLSRDLAANAEAFLHRRVQGWTALLPAIPSPLGKCSFVFCLLSVIRTLHGSSSSHTCGYSRELGAYLVDHQWLCFFRRAHFCFRQFWTTTATLPMVAGGGGIIPCLLMFRT